MRLRRRAGHFWVNRVHMATQPRKRAGVNWFLARRLYFFVMVAAFLLLLAAGNFPAIW